MGSARTIQLWLLACLAFSSLADVSALKVMSAPNLLRIGAVENIFVECHDCTTGNVPVEIIVMNYPAKDKRLASASVTLKGGEYQDLGQIKIPAGDFSKDPNMKQYVYLQAHFPDVQLEKVVLVSFQSGYIFIQTDKTLYTPNSKVNYRIFAMTPSMEPLEKNETTTDASIITEIETPDGIILPVDQVFVESGIHSGAYQLGEIVRPGLWKVVAKFQNSPQHSYSAEFEVKEYVLPSFEVKLTSEERFFHVDCQNITISIKATYLFDEDVDGMAYVVFGVMQNDQKRSFPGSLQRVPIKSGNGKATLQRQHITQTFQNITALVGSSIYVAVSVLTESGSEMVEAELRGIQIVTSPYTIHFKSTPKYFKPGMPFDVAIEVVNPDGTPAQGVAVGLDGSKDNGLTATNGMARLSIPTNSVAEPLTITARTDVSGISQASATMTAHPYETPSKSYIHIGVDAKAVKLGESLKINFILSQHQNAKKHMTYLILSRGRLVKHGRHPTNQLTAMRKIITKDMLPSFRIIAYYFTNDNEVVSDSLWVDVEDSCMGSLKLEPTRAVPSYEPRKMFGLKVTGDPGATVGLVAVDKGVYVLNNKHRLTQKKVWDLVEKYDTGCTPGGGQNSMRVFYDAGVLFKTNIHSGTPYRQDLKCPLPSRRKKRASTIMDVRTSLVSEFIEKKQRDCCLDGMRDTPLSYDCKRRSEYIDDDPACVMAFLHCCNKMEMEQAARMEDNLLLARSEEDDSYMDSHDIVSRTQFPESWLWSNIKLPACPSSSPNCGPTSNSTKVPLKDSITTWQLTGISLSKTHGICVGDPLEVIVRKDFFIDLRLPYSAVRGEQLEIKAVLHNYKPDPITVRVELLETQHVCSSASRRGKYRQEINVGAQTTRSVPFIIIPMKNGKLPIEVKAAVKESSVSDGVRKDLLVVPQGMLTKSLKTIVLDPARKGVDGRQMEIMKSEIPEKDLVPNTPTTTHISVTGREQISALVENAISGNSLGTLIRQPSGCGEQNMIGMTLPVIATVYLDKTNQWETVGFDKRAEALQHIRTGYQNELAYRKDDGGFAVFPNRKSSTWLTAYVAKVFAMAFKLVGVQSSVICDAIKFLILNTQQPDGSFTEVGSIIHGEMIGDVLGKDSDASLTAFCLIAMQESYIICNSTVNSLTPSIKKAVAYLEDRVHNLVNSYAAAMTSYALANEDKLNREILNKFASSGSTHWPVRDSQLFTLEATAYALLALVKAKAFDDARPVVRWFNKQQIDGGGYGSTQATIMVYQAIAEYWISANEAEYGVNVDIDFPGRTKLEKFKFDKGNHYTTRTSKFNKINQNVTVTATGSGEATVKMVSMYYALLKEEESHCQKFNLSVQLDPVKMDEDEKVYKLIIKVLLKDQQRNVPMTILDIGLLTGFTVNTDDLKSLSQGYARTISRYEMNSVLSERGSLIIYLDKVSNIRPEEIAFRIHQKTKVGVLQPAAVSVYEYYNHQNNNQSPCVKFYRPQRRSGELLTLCRNNECACAEENCSMQKKGKIRNEDRTAKACETELNSKVDFVYKVRLENFTDGLSTDIYTMRVVELIKEGSDECQRKPGEDKKTCDVGPLGKLRPFLSYQDCRESLNLKVGKTYLVMGITRDIYKDEEKQSYQYILGERTWIEYWPTEAECQTEEYRQTCLGMEELLDQLRIFGCQL